MEESDETLYWFELLTESGIAPPANTTGLYKETDKTLAMTVASLKTLRSRKS